MSQTTISKRPPRQLGSMADAAGLLGVTPRTVRRYITEGRLTGYRVGPHLLRLDLAEVEAMIQPIPTAASC